MMDFLFFLTQEVGKPSIVTHSPYLSWLSTGLTLKLVTLEVWNSLTMFKSLLILKLFYGCLSRCYIFF